MPQRGSLAFWVSSGVVQGSRYSPKNDQRGCDYVYTDQASLTMYLLQEFYQLAWQKTKGLFAALLDLLSTDLAALDYSTLCRCHQMLEVALSRHRCGEALHLLADKTH